MLKTMAITALIVLVVLVLVKQIKSHTTALDSIL